LDIGSVVDHLPRRAVIQDIVLEYLSRLFEDAAVKKTARGFDGEANCERAQGSTASNIMLLVGPHRPFRSQHPNLARLFYVFESDQAFHLLFEYYEHSLQTVLQFNPSVLTKASAGCSADVKRRFVIFQLLQVETSRLAWTMHSTFIVQHLLSCQVLSFCHQRGVTHGNLSPGCIMLTHQMWVHVQVTLPCVLPMVALTVFV
jgi:hypothetical protein